MSKLVTNNLKLFGAEQLIESFSEPKFDNYFYFVGTPLPYTNDSSPPLLNDSVQTVFIDPYENMLYGKRITANDVVLMTDRHDWTSNTVYNMYTHDDTNLLSTVFFVCVDEGSSYSVFKCLDNNKGSPSTIFPSASETSADDDMYFTSDGYQWKYMYSITTSQFNKFATATHIPVIVNANVVANAVSGSIDNIKVVVAGNSYASYTNGAFNEVRVGGNNLVYAIDPTNSSSNSNFYTDSAIKVTSGVGSGQQRKIVGYTVSGSTRRVVIDSEFTVNPTTSSHYDISPLVTITGDGSNAVARAIVNSVGNTINSIEITSRGSGYTYATATLSGNNGTVNTSQTSTLKVIVSPKGGHGSNAAAELAGHQVGLSVVFDADSSDGKLINANDFRTVGIIKNPLQREVILTISGASGSFSVGETLTQQSNSFNAYGVVTQANSSTVVLTNALGFFSQGNSTFNVLVGNSSGSTAICDLVSQINLYFDQTTKVVGSLQTAQGFTFDELVTQSNTGNGYFYASNTTVVRLVNQKGTLLKTGDINQYIDGDLSDARFLVSNTVSPDIIKGSGDIIYIENFSPINKSNGQTETIKLVLEF